MRLRTWTVQAATNEDAQKMPKKKPTKAKEVIHYHKDGSIWAKGQPPHGLTLPISVFAGMAATAYMSRTKHYQTAQII